MIAAGNPADAEGMLLGPNLPASVILVDILERASFRKSERGAAVIWCGGRIDPVSENDRGPSPLKK